MPSKYWDKVSENTSPETDKFAQKSFDLVDMINAVLDHKDVNQAKLAKLLGKSPSEIHKLLSPGQNMTIKTIAKLETALGVPLMTTPLRTYAMATSNRFDKNLESQHYAAIMRSEKPLDRIKYVTGTDTSVSSPVSQIKMDVSSETPISLKLYSKNVTELV